MVIVVVRVIVMGCLIPYCFTHVSYMFYNISPHFRVFFRFFFFLHVVKYDKYRIPNIKNTKNITVLIQNWRILSSKRYSKHMHLRTYQESEI